MCGNHVRDMGRVNLGHDVEGPGEGDLDRDRGVECVDHARRMG